MNGSKFVAGLLIFLAGGATGAAVTYFATKKHFEQQAMDEIDSMRKWIKERAEADELDDHLCGDTLDPEYREEMIQRYRAYLQALGDEDFDVEGVDDPNYVPAINPPEDETGIEEITSEEFTVHFPGYDAVSLSYYAGDNTYVTSDDEVLPDADIPVYIGSDAVDKIAGIRDSITVETESLFIVNHDLATAYEIMLMPGKYLSE